MDIYDELNKLCHIIKESGLENPVLIAFMNPETGNCGRMVHGDSFMLMYMIDRIIEMMANDLSVSFNDVLNMMKFAHSDMEGNHGSIQGNL